MASGSSDKTIILWDVATRQPLGSPLSGHTDAVASAAFNPDGSILATGSWDKTIILWDLATRKPLGPSLKAHSGQVFSLAFSPDNRLLASGSSDKAVILWDMNTRLSLGRPLTGHTNALNALAFSPDSQFLVSGDSDGNIILWNAATGQPLGFPFKVSELGSKPALSGLVWSLVFSPDGKTLASAHGTKDIALWDVEHRKMLTQIDAGLGGAWRCAAFSPDLRMLAAGSTDRFRRPLGCKKTAPLGCTFNQPGPPSSGRGLQHDG